MTNDLLKAHPTLLILPNDGFLVLNPQNILRIKHNLYNIII